MKPWIPAPLASLWSRIALVLPLVFCGCDALSLRSSSEPELSFTQYQLANGLTVILHEDSRLPLVAVNLWYRVGSKDEPIRRSGFAHLFEHLMFTGTETVPDPQFDVTMERFGGRNNASTGRDRTNYYESGPSELLRTFLFLEADRMGGLGAAMTPAKLDAERKVVHQERFQQIENRPYGKARIQMPPLLYPPGHPYREPIIGSAEDLDAATVEDVQRFFDQFYFAANATLVIAGDFDSATVKRWVAAYFGPLPTITPLEDPPPPLARLDAVVRRSVTDSVELPMIAFAWHSPPFYAPGDAALDILADVLGGGKASRLYRRLVYEEQVAQSVSAYQGSQLLGSEFRVTVLVRPGVELERVEQLVDEELSRLSRGGPTEREVERARNSIETSFWQGLESVGDRAELLNQYHFYLRDPGSLSRDRERYAAITPADVQRWSQEVLDLQRRVILRVLPEDKKSASAVRFETASQREGEPQ